MCYKEMKVTTYGVFTIYYKVCYKEMKDYHISAIFHTISKINFWNFAKSFVKNTLTLS